MSAATLFAPALFAIDPVGLGGVVLRGPSSPARDAWMAQLRALLPPETPLRRVPLSVSEGRLLGGLDLAATLRAGRPLAERGLLAEADGGVVLLAMAERIPAGTVARIAAAMDTGAVSMQRDGLAQHSPARIGVVAFDEGVDDERLAAPLLDRLAFHLDPERAGEAEPGDVVAARARLPAVVASDAVVEGLCAAAQALGIASVRAVLFAVRAARAAAALAGRDDVSAEDAALAAQLVLAPRATVLPVPEQAPEQAAEQEPDPDGAAPEGEAESPQPEAEGPAGMAEIVLDAAAAAIPPGLLAQLQGLADKKRSAPPGRVGVAAAAGLRGRPAGTRPGDGRSGLRLNLIETMRAAAPWQRLRATPGREGLQFRREDFRVTRLKQRTQTTTIFLVDASGSQAFSRLAEAKGAVELLLAECYVRRDQVAVLAFRGRAAQLLLPPTRSLVRAKRSLAGLPGGGGTPLASGLDAGCTLADAVRRRGGTPALVLLTDGRPNVGRDGKGGRAAAERDATDAAQRLRAARHAALLVDTAARPSPAAQQLAVAMGARYVALPFAGAAGLARAVRAA